MKVKLTNLIVCLRLKLVALLLLILLSVLPGCSSKVTADSLPTEKLTPVNIVTIRSTPYTSKLNLMASLMPMKQVTIVAKANGTLNKLFIDLGDKVRLDQLVAQIDDELYQSLFKQAESQLDLSASTYRRISTLHEKQLASTQELETAKLQKASADSAFTVARINLENTMVKAPISGIISAKLIEANNQVGIGTPIAIIVDVTKLKITAGVSDIEIERIGLNNSVKVSVDAFPNEVFSGRISAVGVQASSADNMYPVEIIVDNPGQRLKPGMTAEVSIDKHYFPQAIVILQSVVLEREDGKYVMLEHNGKAVLRKVELGDAFGESVQVTNGLSIGEKLITSGHLNVVDGEEIKIAKSQ